MAEDKNTFYTTTPIYYVTARPHVGSLYSTVIADALARWHRMLGQKTFFLTGTDEHGQKIAEAAAALNESPKEFVDEVSKAYKDIWHLYDLDYTDFIRTTDERHKKAVYYWIQKAQEKGDIYKGFYEGWYCVPDEHFIADKDASDDAEPPLCPLCGRKTIHASEESYFFRLSAYQDRLLKFYKENPHFITPKERLNEVISFVESGLHDLSISRKSVSWGIPFPGDPKHVVYVWVDALTNYISAIGYGDPNKSKEFKQWWPADVHVMAKEIVRFHAIYWPAFLMAADLPMPKKLLVHGWIMVDGQKMSKSLGNVVDPLALAQKYGIEPVKYYMLRQLPITHDANFSYADLEHAINADLAGGVGNLLNRLIALAEKNNMHELHAPAQWSSEASALYESSIQLIKDYTDYLENCSFHLALGKLWQFVHQANAYFHAQEPWKVAKVDAAKFEEILSATAHALRTMAVLLWPVMPQKMEALLQSIGVKCIPGVGSMGGVALDEWTANMQLTKIPALFEKVEKEEKKSEEVSVKKEEPENSVNIETVASVELVVGTIIAVDQIEKSEKLLKMQVDFGDRGQRTILAGVKKWYVPEDLIGKQATFVFNLAPRKMAGEVSQGMMLMGEDADGKPHPVSPAQPVPNGTRLR